MKTHPDHVVSKDVELYLPKKHHTFPQVSLREEDFAPIESRVDQTISVWFKGQAAALSFCLEPGSPN